MGLDVRGNPLHTRALAVTLRHTRDGRLGVDGYVLDLRKRGVIPVAADLQGPGLIHHMQIEARIDPPTLVLEEILARQPQVAFEASAATRGETCRDPMARIEALRGTAIDADYGRRLGDAIGGPRGCSHVLTLAHLVGSTVRWAAERHAPGPRHPGERLFRRDIILDGHEPAAHAVEVAIQLTDMRFAPAGGAVQPMTRFEQQYEFRALVRIDLTTLTIAGLDLAERRRSLRDIDTSEWVDRADIAEGLVGQPVLRGISLVLLERLAVAPADAPIYDALLMLAPTMIQCFATMSDAWLSSARDADTVVGMGGIPDSCYMWRRGGALHEARRPGDPMPSVLK